MKRLLFVLLLFAVPARATPLYFQFDGIVISNRIEPAPWITDPGPAVGTPVSFLFLVDFDRPGAMEDTDETDFFYAEFLSGDAYRVPTGNIGWNNGNPVAPAGMLMCCSRLSWSSIGDAPFTIFSVDLPVSLWTPGLRIIGEELRQNLRYDLTLTNNGSLTTPEPASLALLFLGLGILYPVMRARATAKPEHGHQGGSRLMSKR